MAKNQSADTTLVIGDKSNKDEPQLPKGRKYSLVVLEGKNQGRDYQIKKWTIIIGRDASVSDFVIDDPGASRSHACLEFANDVFSIEDLESTNGLSVNGKPQTNAVLKHGDQITIGKTVLQYLEESHEPRSKIYQIDEDL